MEYRDGGSDDGAISNQTTASEHDEKYASGYFLEEHMMPNFSAQEDGQHASKSEKLKEGIHPVSNNEVEKECMLEINCKDNNIDKNACRGTQDKEISKTSPSWTYPDQKDLDVEIGEDFSAIKQVDLKNDQWDIVPVNCANPSSESGELKDKEEKDDFSNELKDQNVMDSPKQTEDAGEAVIPDNKPILSSQIERDCQCCVIFQTTEFEMNNIAQFPALENVDFESDEDIQDLVKISAENQNKETLQVDDPAVEENQTELAYQSDEKAAKSTQTNYPLNYQNYKVCKEVQPGVKTCLILETGEEVTYISKLKSCSANVSALDLVENEMDLQLDVSQDECNTDTNCTENTSQERLIADHDSKNLKCDFAHSSRNESKEDCKHSLDNSLYSKDNDQDGQNEQLGIKTEKMHFMVVQKDDDSEGNEIFVKEKKGDSTDDVLNRGDIEIDNQGNHLKSKHPWKSNRHEAERFVEGRPDLEEIGNEQGSDFLACVNLHGEPISNANNSNVVDPIEKIKHDGKESYTDNQSKGVAGSYSPKHGVGQDLFISRQNGSLADVSQVSSRYFQLDHHRTGRSRNTHSEPVTFPKFNTLQDQQVSWLEMFKVIEKQHRSDLQSQYIGHQRILRDMQKNMEEELSKQQDILKQRLTTHKEILEEFTPGGTLGELNPSSQQKVSTCLPQSKIKEASSISNTSFETKIPVQYPMRGSLEKDMIYPSRLKDSSQNLTQVALGGDKLLRGGVYSSPMPLIKPKQKNAPSFGMPQDGISTSSRSPQHNVSHNASLSHWKLASQMAREDSNLDGSLYMSESDDVLSPRTRIGLREKHAKHLADLRAYYEEELEEMKLRLNLQKYEGHNDKSDSQDKTGPSSCVERILADENAELRKRCQQLEDTLDDAKIEMRELKQKIQGLEIRSADYADRYDKSQAQVFSLGNRLEEVTEYAKEKEAGFNELECKYMKSGEELQKSYKKEKELNDSLHAAKITIQKLVDKYESLEKEHRLMKQSQAEKEEKLHSSRSKLMNMENKLSKLEMDNKQVAHDNEILKHEISLARRQFCNPHQEQNASHLPISPDPDSYDDSLHSPIVKAEKELKMIQGSMINGKEFVPKLQHKFYGTNSSNQASSFEGQTTSATPQRGKAYMSAFGYHVPKMPPSREKKKNSERTHLKTSSSKSKRSGSHSGNTTPICKPHLIEKDVNHVLVSSNLKDRGRRKGSTEKLDLVSYMTEDQAIKGIRTGEILSRPAWEDVFSSMTPGKFCNGNSKGYSTDQVLKERLESIEHLERKYDDLSNEKRKYESALSKVPAQGHQRVRENLELELDRVDRELGSIRMSLKRCHVLKSTI